MNHIPFYLYTVGFIIISIIRAYYTKQYKNIPKKLEDKNTLDRILLAFTGISMIIPFVYKFTDFMDFADYELPLYFSIAGFIIFLFAAWLLKKSHTDLGEAWSARPEINKKQKLVTHGIYNKIRHPMYAAHILWGIAQILLIHNWIAGFSLYITTLLLYLSRVNREEKMLYQEFGSEYSDYMRKTGRIMPIFKVR